MIYKHRTLEKIIKKALKTFPAIIITGPRQSGKTTLLKNTFLKSHKFISLEDPDIRIRAKDDPKGFLNQYKPPIIIDEIQYFPELLSYIKSIIDIDRKPGNWILTGSQNFVLMHNISQSLAGRSAILSLLPFSISEQMNNGQSTKDITNWLKHLDLSTINKNSNKAVVDILLRGHYPEIVVNKQVDRQLWCGSYITTYLERDVRNIANIGDHSQFERFLRLCATQTAQILNISSFARDIGVSVPTVKRWLSILEASYIIYLLYPYYKNIGKRIIKSPKLYFIDTALCSYLLGLHNKETLQNSMSFGHLFETMIISDFLKRFLHFGEMPSMYYLRTRDGLEIDIVIESEGRLNFFEIKTNMTITSKHAYALRILKNELNNQINKLGVISMTKDNFHIINSINNYGWQNILFK